MAKLTDLIAYEEHLLGENKRHLKKSYIRLAHILRERAGTPLGLGAGFAGGFLLGLHRRHCPAKKASDDTVKEEQQKAHLLSNQALWVFLTTALTQYLQNRQDGHNNSA